MLSECYIRTSAKHYTGSEGVHNLLPLTQVLGLHKNNSRMDPQINNGKVFVTSSTIPCLASPLLGPCRYFQGFNTINYS